MKTLWCFSGLFFLATGIALADPACNLSQSPPLGWKALNAGVVSLRVPPGFRLRRIDTFDTWAYEVAGDKVTFTVEFGLPASDEKVPGEKLVQVDGTSALLESRGDAIDVSWPNLGSHRSMGLTARFSREADRQFACRVIAGVRVLGSIDDLAVLGIRTRNGRHTALVEVRRRYRRTFREGDVATLDFGKIRTIGADFVEVAEVIPNGAGGWLERVTRLKSATAGSNGKRTP